MKKIIFLPLILFFIYSCDIIIPVDNYYIADTLNSNQIDTQTAVKKVLVIDFTGIRCTNCPSAHETIHELQDVYSCKIIPVAIHGTGLAYPIGEYTVDLRTDDGNEIISTFGINSIPIGLVDNYCKNSLLQQTAWADAVTNVIDEEPLIKLDLDNFYNSSDNNLEISINILSLSELKSELKLCVFILEDSIITRQATDVAPGYIENYVQMNVFRDAISNVWGDDVVLNSLNTETKTYNYSVNNLWNINNCSVVAFIFDESFKILNVEEDKIE